MEMSNTILPLEQSYYVNQERNETLVDNIAHLESKIVNEKNSYKGVELARILCQTFPNMQEELSGHIWKMMDDLNDSDLLKLHDFMEKEVKST